MSASSTIKSRSTNSRFKNIISQEAFNQYVNYLTKRQLKRNEANKTEVFKAQNVKRNQRFLPMEEPSIPFNQKNAREQLAEMQTSITTSGINLCFWYFNKIMRRAIQGLFVDTNSVKMLKGLIDANHKVILMPIYKSFADFFVHLYVCNN